MFVRFVAAAVLMSVSAPALAQDAPAAAAPVPSAPVAPAATPALTEADIQARGTAFEASLKAMGAEVQTAIDASGGDAAKARADTDPIVAKYQPDADAFADVLTEFLTGTSSTVPEAERAQMTAMLPIMQAEIKGAPSKMRDQAIAAMAMPAALATAPAATPQ